MSKNAFQQHTPSVIGNPLLRTPQRESYIELSKQINNQSEKEFGIVLPVGCGKSGCITLAPFAFKAKRTLVVAPGLNIAEQLHKDFDPSNPDNFLKKCQIISQLPYPEPAEIRGKTTNFADLNEADIVITNIQQLQGDDNRWLQKLPDDFFDLILFDEGHHSVAASWSTLKDKFTSAKIVNYSATPLRADGQKMAGNIIYSFPVFRAIQEGFVKKLKAIVLNPKSLNYIRNEGDKEIKVSLEEIRELGESDSEFRRSIVSSEETLNTIVDASIHQLYKKRKETKEDRLKIIASALNFSHCHQIVEAYRARGLKADFVHSNLDGPANQKVMSQLENHELDVIVQVKKLGEGFDHPYLAVAAVLSIFSNLSPFVQFVGRIMRVIKQNDPSSPLNHGSVIFHAGANIARRWEDFQEYSEADQAFFDQLLPIEDLNFENSDELELTPNDKNITQPNNCDIKSQTTIELEEIPLISDDPEALAAVQLLNAKGYTAEQVNQVFEKLTSIPVTKVRQRQAMRNSLDSKIKTTATQILSKKDFTYQGYDLDKNRLGRTNFVVLKSAIDKQVNALVGKGNGTRDEFTQAELNTINDKFDHIIALAQKDVFHG